MKKNFVVIDQDETVSNIILKCIQGFNPIARIELFPDLKDAQLYLLENKVDCLITDSICLLDFGVQDFFKAFIQTNQIRDLLITTYGEGFSNLPDIVKDQYPIISKPIDYQLLSSIIQNVSGPLETEIVQQASLTSEQYTFCQKTLYRLKSSTGARCILLSDTVGRILSSVGDTGDINPELIVSLLGGGIATLLEAGKSLEDESVIHLSYREGKLMDLYAVNIGKDILLVLVVSKTQGYAKLGAVWYYARQSALHLADYLRITKPEAKGMDFGNLSTDAISDELDKLFGG